METLNPIQREAAKLVEVAVDLLSLPAIYSREAVQLASDTLHNMPCGSLGESESALRECLLSYFRLQARE
jgi:hypothetical protein